MEEYVPRSADEIRLREWMNGHHVYPGNMEMQSLILNSYYSDFEEQYVDDELIPLDEVGVDAVGLSEGFDYRAHEKTDEEEEKAWHQRVSYCLNDLDKFLAYIDAEWRDENE